MFTLPPAGRALYTPRIVPTILLVAVWRSSLTSRDENGPLYPLAFKSSLGLRDEFEVSSCLTKPTLRLDQLDVCEEGRRKDEEGLRHGSEEYKLPDDEPEVNGHLVTHL